MPPNCVSDLPNSRLSGHADPQLPNVISSADMASFVISTNLITKSQILTLSQTKRTDPNPKTNFKINPNARMTIVYTMSCIIADRILHAVDCYKENSLGGLEGGGLILKKADQNHVFTYLKFKLYHCYLKCT